LAFIARKAMLEACCPTTRRIEMNASHPKP
jgi:hypothetical protein